MSELSSGEARGEALCPTTRTNHTRSLTRLIRKFRARVSRMMRGDDRRRAHAIERASNSVAAINDHMIVELLILGFILSLDNFRASIALGTVPFSFRRAVQVALMFGLWDGLMPLVGGHCSASYVSEAIGTIADVCGGESSWEYTACIFSSAHCGPQNLRNLTIRGRCSAFRSR